jgi:hypothetical protein
LASNRKVVEKSIHFSKEIKYRQVLDMGNIGDHFAIISVQAQTRQDKNCDTSADSEKGEKLNQTLMIEYSKPVIPKPEHPQNTFTVAFKAKTSGLTWLAISYWQSRDIGMIMIAQKKWNDNAENRHH